MIDSEPFVRRPSAFWIWFSEFRYMRQCAFIWTFLTHLTLFLLLFQPACVVPTYIFLASISYNIVHSHQHSLEPGHDQTQMLLTPPNWTESRRRPLAEFAKQVVIMLQYPMHAYLICGEMELSLWWPGEINYTEIYTVNCEWLALTEKQKEVCFRTPQRQKAAAHKHTSEMQQSSILGSSGGRIDLHALSIPRAIILCHFRTTLIVPFQKKVQGLFRTEWSSLTDIQRRFIVKVLLKERRGIVQI